MDVRSLYLGIINNLYDGIYVVDPHRKIIFWNKAAEEITGYTKEEVVGVYCQNNILNHIDKDGKPLCVLGCPLYDTLVDGKTREEEVFLRHKNGYRVAVTTKVLPIREGDKIIGCVEIFKPVTLNVYNDELVAELTDLALNDPLTRLYNRRYVESFISHKINEFERFGVLFCILFMDIDNFGFFNNNYGHEMGDRVLKSISSTLQNNLRKSDIVGRWGGEEFIGVFELIDPKQAPIVGEKIRMLVQNTEVLHNDKQLNVTVSVGITVVQPGDTVSKIVARADELMYKSKQRGKNCVTAD